MGDSVTNTHLATHTAGYSVKKSLASPPSSVVERQTFNLVVVGSIPTVGLEHLIKFLGSTSGSRYQGRCFPGSETPGGRAIVDVHTKAPENVSLTYNQSKY